MDQRSTVTIDTGGMRGEVKDNAREWTLWVDGKKSNFLL